MDKENGAILFGAFVGVVIASAIFGLIADAWRAEATARGYAQHNQKTGVWEWKEPVREVR